MKTSVIRLLLLGALASTACAGPAAKAPTPAPPPAGPQTEDEKTLYAIGLVMAQNVKPFNLSPTELEMVARGMADSVAGKPPAVALETYGPKIQEFGRARVAASASGTKQKDNAFLDKAAQEAGAVKSPSGLIHRTLTPGKGASPAATDTVKVHYRGTLTDGKEFDSSIARGQPVEFKLNQVIPCWTEGVQAMKVGEKAQLVCPSDIAYGDQGRPPIIPGGATLVFEVELLGIKK
jgi:FKBP-type peptidyl-prolyl cis-trans isomerase FkpA